jgi:adenosylcobinamide-phosphate synthase
MLYKAVNTHDSTFSYKNGHYGEFGWVSTRMDDVANYIPARLAAMIIPGGTAILQLSLLNSHRILLRDGEKHVGPNSGLTEAALAGPLAVQLGELNNYFGQPSMRPTLGDSVKELRKKDVVRANTLMLITLILATIIFLAVRFSLYW